MLRKTSKVFISLFPFPRLSLLPFTALREKMREGYSLRDLKSDFVAGIIVGLVALPLGMALAIASGVSPQSGLYTVIIAGAVVSALGGSRFQITGPTAAFVVILAPIGEKFGLGGLLMAGLLAGVFLIAMGFFRMGRLIQFIPHPVTTGFTAGISVVIGLLQIKDFLGLKISVMPEHFLEKLIAIITSLPSFAWPEAVTGCITLLLLIYWPRLPFKIAKTIPAPLFSLSVVTVGIYILQRFFPEIEIATIYTKFNGIPSMAPHWVWPWQMPGPDGSSLSLSFGVIKTIFPSALTIALLGGIESLLSAVVADGMTQTQHDPDSELIAVGVGNVFAPFFGGIAATGAIARTATNIRFGAQSPLSGVFHALFVLIVVVFFAKYVSFLPIASMAAMLMLIAYNMADHKHFFHIVKAAPLTDILVLLICFSLTVIFDMVMGVSVGIVLAAFLFMKRMSDIIQIEGKNYKSVPIHKYEKAEITQEKVNLPSNLVVYNIAGPLFFGAAKKAASAVTDITDQVKAVVFKMDQVPMMDFTGLVALEGAIKKIISTHKRHVFLVGVTKESLELIEKSILISKSKQVSICDHLDDVLKRWDQFIQ